VASDVWSYGVLLYEIWTRGETPYSGMDNRKVWMEITSGYRLPCPAGCEQEIYQRMLACWKTNPHERASFRLLCQFFRNRSFALSTLPFYELPPVAEARWVKISTDKAKEAVKGASSSKGKWGGSKFGWGGLTKHKWGSKASITPLMKPGDDAAAAASTMGPMSGDAERQHYDEFTGLVSI
jgi:hypothetical protein